ncbi:VanZ family protein [Pseudoalteromonas sp. S16_S37]|uniref:VanZ family protein n=1 Tax=Pseudoalteromonas sp. S16_S37 TaxID=2720228 RepID=UPI0016816530|nr:VanZ family protein [Pseudoalteromonas sp. S16_S37]
MTRRVYQVLLLITLAVCTYLFAREFQHSGIQVEHADKVVHFAIFFVLAFIMHHAFKWPMIAQLILLTGYGIGIEVMQDSLPYRQASLGDFVADFFGALSYYLGYLALRFWRDKKHV